MVVHRFKFLRFKEDFWVKGAYGMASHLKIMILFKCQLLSVISSNN